jgi:Domain of unknown function (DUF5615)
MSSPRFLVNHDFNEIIIRGVERFEPAIEFLRVREVGLDRSADKRILEYAAREMFLVLSHDVRTMTAAAYRQLAKGLPMSGLFLVHQGSSFKQVIEDLILIWSASDAEDWRNPIEYLPFK